MRAPSKPVETALVSGSELQRSLLPTAIVLPGSKYYTLRFLLNALLADGESVVRFPACSDDTAVLLRSLRALGAEVTWEPAPLSGAGVPVETACSSGSTSWQLRIRGTSGRLALPPGSQLPMGNAGAVLRLLLGLGALLPEVTYTTDHAGSLGRRPNADLLGALTFLGIQVEAQGEGGCLPITLRGGPPRGGSLTISGARSSQYVSALLYLAPLLPEGLEIRIGDELRSRSMVRATLSSLASAGIQIQAAPDLKWFHVPGGQVFRARSYDVPGDGPTAAALVAAALALGRPLTLARLAYGEPDVVALLAALRDLGAQFTVTEDEEATTGLGTLHLAAGAVDSQDTRLHGARIDGDACIDSVPVLAAIACFARGESRFERVSTLRWKESDRIADLAHELQRAGCWVTPGEDTISVSGQPEGIVGGVTVEGHDDHRVVQALAIAALHSAHGLTIQGADAVAKSYPEFFTALQQCGAQVYAAGVAP
ncbi:MAG: 3-phosphoshikimate 1-carboxyvinyltransferase [Ktedonobacterales bacterium]